MNYERLCRIALNSLTYTSGPAVFHRLTTVFGSASEVFLAGEGDLVGVKGVSAKVAGKIRETDPVATATHEVETAGRGGAELFTLGDDGYPEPLANVYSPPPVLYVAGEWRGGDALSIAVVGSRSPTAYGKALTAKMAGGLAEAGLTIVSGLARGVDAIAHRAAMGSGGRTAAVLGCGLNIYYPSEHRQLQKKIQADGAVISQFPFTAKPDRILFPLRNRIISGLTLGTLVIEAAAKSGALITAYAAIEDNREVFALPGQVNSPKSEGTNRLIKKGHAKLVQSVDDILDELPESVRNRVAEKQVPLPIPEDEPLTGEEEKIMGALCHEARHIDTVAQMSGLPLNIVSAILLALELKGKAKQLPGKLFMKG